MRTGNLGGPSLVKIWKDNGWRCRTKHPIGHVDLLGLTHLYQPLVGASAISLYLTLYNQLLIEKSAISDFFGYSYLMQLTALSHESLLEARYFLEAVGLLNTYEIHEGAQVFFEYEIVSPLTAIRFFQSDVLSLALCHALGKERFVKLKKNIIEGESSPHHTPRGEDVTKSFQEVFGSFSPAELAKSTEVDAEMSWMMKEEHESYIEGKKPVLENDNLTLIRERLANRLKTGVWSQELENQLKEIRFLYQLDDWDLLKALQNPDVFRNGHIDMKRLRDFVRGEYHLRFGSAPIVTKSKQTASPPASTSGPIPKNDEEKHFQQLAKMSPLELLSHYQGGSRIPDSDVVLVESLLRDYGLPHGVVNVLLEYVLLKYNYRLPKSLVAKIAGHWKRLRIKTVPQALEQARKEDWDGKQKERKPQKQNQRKKSVEKIPSALAQQLESKPVKAEVKQETQEEAWKYINQQLAQWQKQKRSNSN